MTKVLPFEMCDLQGFVPKWSLPTLEIDMQKSIESPLRRVLSFIDEKGMYAIIGANDIRTDVAEVWVVPCERINDNKFGFFKTIKKLCYDFMFGIQGYKRLEFTVRADYIKGINLAKTLGFEREGYCKKWDGEHDHVLFAKVV